MQHDLCMGIGRYVSPQFWEIRPFWRYLLKLCYASWSYETRSWRKCWSWACDLGLRCEVGSLWIIGLFNKAYPVAVCLSKCMFVLMSNFFRSCHLIACLEQGSNLMFYGAFRNETFVPLPRYPCTKIRRFRTSMKLYRSPIAYLAVQHRRIPRGNTCEVSQVLQ